MALKFLFRRFSRNLGVDLGTANTLIYVQGEGIVLREPSVVAKRADDGQIIAVGEEAKRMVGRTPGEIVATRPLRDGVIADFDTTAAMLAYFIRKGLKNRTLLRPTVIVGIPSGVTGVERRAVIDATEQAGAREAYLIEEPMAAAIGAGLPISEPVGSMVVDIGGGTTEVAGVSLRGLVTATPLPGRGGVLEEAIIPHVEKEDSPVVGVRPSGCTKVAGGGGF